MKRSSGVLLISLAVLGALTLALFGKGCGSAAPAKIDAGGMVDEQSSLGAAKSNDRELNPGAGVRLAVQEQGLDALVAKSSDVKHRIIRCEVVDESSEDPLAATVRMDAQR